MHLLVLFVAALVCSGTNGSTKPGELVLKATPRVIVDAVTQEFTVECKPTSDIEDGENSPLLIDIFRNGETVARQMSETFVMDDNRTTAEGHLNDPKGEKKSTFLSVKITEPTLTDEGVYMCRYIYLNPKYEVKVAAMSVNITAVEVPPPDYVPEVVDDEPVIEEAGCACDEIWDEINSLKATLVKENEKLKQEVQKYNETCRVSFSARFSSLSIPISSESLAPFADVISNKGGAFETEKSAFVAPCTGQYFFSLTLRSQTKMDSGYVDGLILVDGDEAARTSVFVERPITNYQSATNGVVVTLTQGQEVKVHIKTTTFGRFRGSTYSVFSGFYLYP